MKNNIDNIVLKIGHSLRIKQICNEEQYDHPMTDKRFLK